jgi:hypothetical protein
MYFLIAGDGHYGSIFRIREAGSEGGKGSPFKLGKDVLQD